MKEPIRILHVIGVMNRGGAETMIMNLYRNIDRSKVQFDFVQNEGEEAAYDREILELGGRIYHCPRYKGKNHLNYVKWWNNFFKNNKDTYQIVHGHIGSTASIYLSIAKKSGAYTIAHSHSAGEGSLLYRIFSYSTRNIADMFFACSKDAGISRYGERIGKNTERCIVLNNAIDTKKFAFSNERRVAMRNKLGILEDSLVIGHVGRFVEAKNHAFLLDVFEEIFKVNINAKLLLVGDGELRASIEHIVEEKQLKDVVIFAGIQPNVWDYYQAMDVFLFPSIYEGLPVSMVEAQAAGLPCFVSSNVPYETAITDLVDFISLDISPKNWALKILDNCNAERLDVTDKIKKAGYDVSYTANWLTDFYLKVGKNFEG